MAESSINDWKIEELTGYKPITSFYRDFGAAEQTGEKGIKETFRRLMKTGKTNYKYLTELVMVLDWKALEHIQSDQRELSQIYYGLWCDADEYAQDHLTGEELEYYSNTAD